jgi:hypothetical protein
LGPNILLHTLFSNTFNVSPLNIVNVQIPRLLFLNVRIHL